VRVNGKVAEIGTKVGPGDKVQVSGKLISPPEKERAVYLAYHKPVGIECVTDESVRGNIISAIRYPRRIFPIGRLDVPSEGLIFLTSDGDVVNKILRAGNAHEKEYEVTVNKLVTDEFVARMGSGIPILGTVTQPCRVERLGQFVFSIVLTEGMNRQIRRMCEFLDYEVVKLKRTRIMNVSLGDLKADEWRDLTEEELEELFRMVRKSSNTKEASRPKKNRKGRKRETTRGRPKR
jgi:23S rRNA pseudouridine2604 synthase